MTGQQDEVFAFLADPATHPGAPDVRRIDTHGAVVFLAGGDVYKVKRALRFPYMDYSTLDKRHAACAKEIEVNRANAPGLYRGVAPIRRQADALRLGGEGGEIVEWAVHLARFDENATFDHIAARGRLDATLIARLAGTVAEAHARAPVVTDESAVAAFVRSVDDTIAELREAGERVPPALLKRLGDEVAALRPLLAERCAQGFVRRCHGDLHLRNIVLIDGEPVLFDAIEFDDAIATCDVLFDLAFLLMDLLRVGLPAEANLLLNRILWLAPEASPALSGLPAMPAFLAERAAIRAKIALALARLDARAAPAALEEAGQDLALADAVLTPLPARLVAIGGLSGTGKTSVALALAPGLGGPPGALVLRSDIERKRLMGVEELTHLPEGAYTPEITTAVYARLRRAAEDALKAGASVIVDAVHLRPDEREAIAAVAQAMGVPFTGLWLEADGKLLAQRVTDRRDDASDATAAVVEMQARLDAGPLDWTVIAAGRPLADVLADARAVIEGT